MSDWLFENRSVIYLLLGVTGVIVAALWWRNRKRSYLIGLAAVVGLIGLFFLIDQFVRGESDREQIERQIRSITGSFSGRDIDTKIAPHLSREFVSPAGNRKDAYCKKAADFLRSRGEMEVVVWDFDFQEVARAERNAKVRFAMKVKGSGFVGEVTCLAVFHLDDDNQWRLLSYKIYYPPYTQEEFTQHPF